MSFANVNIGAYPSDSTGDPLRVAFNKINQNFADIAAGVGYPAQQHHQFRAHGAAHLEVRTLRGIRHRIRAASACGGHQLWTAALGQ